MFIINIEDINTNHLYICDKHMANILMQNNIPILSIKQDKYYFMKTKELENFLKGGENKE